MNILVMGAGGFLGTNLVNKLSQNNNDYIRVFDREGVAFDNISNINSNVTVMYGDFCTMESFEHIVEDIDVVYHLVSTTNPSLSNKDMIKELENNVIPTLRLLKSCVKKNVKKIVFLSSGGTVYGIQSEKKNSEVDQNNPISSYGIQKLTIEKYLYLYNYLYDLDYKIIRLSNPYGPHQRPNGGLGVITTFVYKALMGEPIQVYGDGKVIRDFIYVDDAVRGIIHIANDNSENKLFNLGFGEGHSVLDVIEAIELVLGHKIDIQFIQARKADVPYSVLDITRYKALEDVESNISLVEGIRKLIEFMKDYYCLEREQKNA